MEVIDPLARFLFLVVRGGAEKKQVPAAQNPMRKCAKNPDKIRALRLTSTRKKANIRLVCPLCPFKGGGAKKRTVRVGKYLRLITGGKSA